MNLIAFIYLSLTLINFSYSKTSDQCTKSNTFWYSLKYPYIDILKLSPTQSSVYTCQSSPSSQSCCTPETSKDMSSVSELKLKSYAEEKLETLVMMLSNDSYELMNIYLKDLESTKNDLNQLFSTTYGYNYKVHRNFFFTWFDKLKMYMQGRLHNISQLLDNFFMEMAQRIVKILIAPGSSSEVTACHITRLIESKPYQDTDVLLKKKIIRSYPPARLLVNAIGVARDVFGELLKNVSPSSKCTEQFNSLFHCMLCQGLTVKPCSQSCTNVMDNCLGSFKSSEVKKLDRVFIKYIKTLIQLAGKLDNPFNFPEVNNKMNVQISTAIMNIQTMYPNVKEQIKAKCQGGGAGLPISRKRRQASQLFLKWQDPNPNNNNNKKEWWEQTVNKNGNEENKDFNNYQSKPNDVLSPFARMIKQKYKTFENYFRNQKTEFCSKASAVETGADCWNGTMLIKNTIQALSKENKKKNEKVEDLRIKTAVSQLNEITKRIISYLNEVNLDPETVMVQEYKLYVPPKINKPAESIPQNPFNQKIEGSGELESPKLPQPNISPEKSKPDSNQVPPPGPQQPEKGGNWQFPAWPEGSGDAENKLPPVDKTKIQPQLPIKENTVTTTTVAVKKHSKTTTTTKTIMVESTKSSKATPPNQIPDDEDLNPEPVSKVKEPVAIPSPGPTLIQPEGSGNQPVSPDLVENKPPEVPLPIITTTSSLDPVIEGSGDEFKPRTPVEKPDPFLPMLPDSSSKTTTTEVSAKKPEVNPPDEDVVPVEGSGKSPEQPVDVEPPPLVQPPPLNPSQPNVIVTDPPIITTSTESLSLEQYPGKVPSEVWLPGLEGVQNQEKMDPNSTPSGVCSRVVLAGGYVSGWVLILLSIYTRLV